MKNVFENIDPELFCPGYLPLVYFYVLGIVRYLMQEQFIDELVFKCPTLECDLGSAVDRLITQPGQFAGIFQF